MARVVRQRVYLGKSRQKKTARLFLSTRPAPPPAQKPNTDFYVLFERPKHKRRFPRISHRRARRKGFLALLYLQAHQTSVIAPQVQGIQLASALSVLQNLGLVATYSYKSSLTIPRGQIISQSPLAGVSIGLGGALTLIVSSGAAIMPALINTSAIVAEETLMALGLSPVVTEQPRSDVPPNIVVNQAPAAGDELLLGNPAYITVSVPPPGVAGRANLPSTADLAAVQVTVN